MNARFKKYFHSVLDPDEFSMLEDYLKTSRNDKEIAGVMRTLWDETMEEYPDVSKANPGLYKRILEAVEAQRGLRTQRRLKAYTWGLRAAAVVVIALITGSIFYMYSRQEILGRQWHAITTPLGSKTQIILPDSTTIWLNAGSSLKYSNEFGNKKREVHLSGEAFFDVFQNPSKPFLVKTSELTIKSYGTAFNVKSYPDESTIETTLVEGSIGITRSALEHHKKDEVLLEPNQRVVYYRQSRTLGSVKAAGEPEDAAAPEPREDNKQKTTYLISKGIDAREFTAWKEGTFIISGETLMELAVKLERKYNVKIYFENEALKSLRFTGSLENETVEQVIQAIGIAAQIEYYIEDREIWFLEQSK